MKNDYFIPTFIINLKKRPDRLEAVLKEFEGRPEFQVIITEAVENPIGALGLWQSIVKIIKTAKQRDDDVIIICEDDHQFTNFYNKDYLFENIIGAHNQGADLLSGGISGGFRSCFPVSKHRLWIDYYWCNQFLVVYKDLFQKIIDTDFDRSKKVDQTLSGLTVNKMVLYPFVSKQRHFGYSDVSVRNESDLEWAETRFDTASERISDMIRIYSFYHGGEFDQQSPLPTKQTEY